MGQGFYEISRLRHQRCIKVRMIESVLKHPALRQHRNQIFLYQFKMMYNFRTFTIELYIIQKILMKLILLLIVVVFVQSQTDYKLPGLELNKDDLKQIRRAHKYIGWKLKQFQHFKTTKYALFLAVKNYAQQLQDLKKKLVTTIGNYIAGSNNMVYGTRNVILGSNKKIAGRDNWVVSQRQVTSEQIQNNILYFRKWRINLDEIIKIQKKPFLVIENIAEEDQNQLKHYSSIRALERFRRRKCRGNRNKKKNKNKNKNRNKNRNNLRGSNY